MGEDVERFFAAWEAFFRSARARRPGFVADVERASRMTFAQYLLVVGLVDEETLGVRQLADAAGIAAPTASRLLDALVGAGFVERRGSAGDRRRVEIALTPDGREAVTEVRVRVEAKRQRIFDALTPAERADAERVLRRLAEVIEG